MSMEWKDQSQEIKFTVTCKMRRRWIPYFLSALRKMQYLGSIGSSRKVCIFADGDGDFKPKFEFDNKVIDEKFIEVKEKDGTYFYDVG